ncbi:hypothetical protein QOZ96_001637 [Brevundimonas nasdae]|uniref:hypothetical protein n=1 Tax=Brevundimonas nasdae TaxID=172043 RepID=UPI0019141FC4|nr:hypothetical protein [Brevundimonas nasdae]MBK6024976.1 hypothetical protein [Brevundimonas nasdae]MDQ0451690.1 hypothetical protein [Brevundimonas nasdae]
MIWYVLYVLAPIHLVTMVSAHGAQFWADHLRTSGVIPKNTPPLMRAFDLFGQHFISGFYSDRHNLYGSRFITRCVKVARIAAPLDLAAFVVLLVAIFGFGLK